MRELGVEVGHDAEMAGHVFVSFSPGDSGYVQQLVFHLGAAGIAAWTAPQGSAAERIATCAAFVPVVGSEAAGSEDMRREIDQARAAYRPILPVRLGGGLPAALAGGPVEDVGGGRMPSPRFIEELRRLTAAPGGVAPGGVVTGGSFAPRFGDVVPPMKKKSRRGLVIGIGAGGLFLVLLCVGVIVVGGVIRSGANSPDRAVVGDCLAASGEETLDANSVRKVDCASADARFTVVARVEDKTSEESDAACAKDVDFVYWTAPREGARGTVLCLRAR